MAIDTIPQDLDGDGLRIGIVQARFNAWAGEALFAACAAASSFTSMFLPAIEEEG